MQRKVIEVGPEPTNGGEDAIQTTAPYTVDISLVGASDLLFHRWNCEAVASKSAAAKGSKEKKSDNVESYLYRADPVQDGSKGMICMPGEYLRQAIIHAAKYRQDPRSPRKSAMDLFKAGIVNLTPLAPMGADSFDYEHKCRVVIQRNAITRTRPAFKEGWKCKIQLMVITPEYITPTILQEVLNNAGRLIGLGDFRPTYGRFHVEKFDLGFKD